MEFSKMIRAFYLMIGLFLCHTASIASCPMAIHSTSLTSFTLSPDGARIAGVADDGTVFWWDVKSGNLNTLAECLHASAVTFNPTSSRVALGDSQGTIRIFDLSSGHLIQSLGPNISLKNMELGAAMGSIDQIVFSADGERMASHDLNGICVWALNEKKELMTITDERRVEQIALNRDGTVLARGGYGSLSMWDVAMGKAVKTIPIQHDESVESIIFDRDNRWMISAQSHQEINVWDARSGDKLKTLHGQTGHVYFPLIAVGTDSLYSAASDGSLRTWNLSTGQIKATWKEEPGFISADGRFLLQPTAQPGKLALRAIGDSTVEPRYFSYKSPLCTLGDSPEGNDSSTKQWEALQNVGMGESKATDGTHLSFTTYVMRDCTVVTVTYGQFKSANSAVQELNQKAKQASQVIEKGPNMNLLGQPLGERIVLLFQETNSDAVTAAVLWTDSNQYHEIHSSSLSVALDLEKRYRR